MLSRRSFLRAVGGAVAGGVVLGACGSGDGDGEAGDGAADAPGTIAGDHHAEPTDLAPAVLSSDLHVSDGPQRFAFALLAREGYASGGAARLAVAPPGATPDDFVDATLHTTGLPDRRGVYVAALRLGEAGTWSGLVERGDERLEFAFAVKPAAEAPAIGARAPAAASPTPDAPLGVDPICTREPQCPLHGRSLGTLVGAGRPVAVLFATPARCQSAYCGPVLDAMLPLVPDYEDRVDFVHVDIYRDLRSTEVSPTVRDWGLPSEPWLYGIDAAGTITGRLDGAFAQDEMQALLDRLVTA